ncbi:hypothetical protein C1X29_01195 [Pseudomonas sp. GW456-12-10-14-LB2]|uniref:hypothetical protein n=1 Tax=Pseudomonas sp. GW456-12-10-14-LB2 TaxID=2070674 RepID=UPI000C9CB603|nr:hypothetical protein [Pseudomonas sp. GW456-12-10-14-LB2]PNB52262.1 hypothetical protein C1X29_01195 [Pseudomonas sp. GW456-12-10-14-LB2]
MNNSFDNNSRGSAGGAASTVGAVYAGSVGAWCAVQLLLGKGVSLPWKLSDEHSLASITCESSTHVDDLVLQLLPEGTVYIQIKHGLKLGPEFDKAMAQLVRQFWSDSFSCTRDRLVIATDQSASDTVRVAVRNILRTCHDLASGADLEGSATSEVTKKALKRLRTCFENESKVLQKSAQDITRRFRDFLGCTHLSIFETLDGSQEYQAIESLRQVVNPQQARQAWTLLNSTCLDIATLRKSLDRWGFWSVLGRHQIEVSHRRLSLAGVQVQLEDVLRGMTGQRVDELTALGHFVPDLYVPRVELDQHFVDFRVSSSKLMVISGGSGQGKSCWCAHRGKTAVDRPTLLIAAESLEGSDASLNATLIRLVGQYIREHGGHPLPTVELVEWLNHTDILVILDGLDRAPSFSQSLSRWMDATLAQLTQSRLQVILTGRPETMIRLRSTLELSPCVYHPQKDFWQVQLKDFTGEEARTAADRLGDPALAQYPHPSMMSFCAQIQERGDVLLSEVQIVERFILRRISEVNIRADLLDEHLSLFIELLSRALADSEQGVLSRNEVLAMPGFDRLAYEALRRGNFIVETQGVLRVEPDKISERLQGRYLDVKQAITDMEQLKAFPLKMGALRFALLDLAMRDEHQAIEQLKRLIEYSKSLQMYMARGLACSLFEALPDWSSLEPLARALGEGSGGNSVLLYLGSGNALIDLLGSERWSGEQRLRLLWTLAPTESGYDWRPKHWEKRFRASHFHVTPWRKRMLVVLQEPEVDAWHFLVERFDSQQPFEDCNEANMGDLAQGLFFLGAETRIWPALQALAHSESRKQLLMLRLIARDYSDQVAARMGQILSSGLFSLKDKYELALGLQDNASTPAITAAMNDLLADNEDSELQAVCLRGVGRGGDIAAMLKLINSPRLCDFDVAVCMSYSGVQFQAFALRIFERALQREVPAQVLSGFHYGLGNQDQVLAQFKVLEPLFMQALQQLPEAVISISPIVETFIRIAIDSPLEWHGLFELTEAVLRSTDEGARRYIVYACTSEELEAQSVEGLCLRTRIIQTLIERETDEENLELLEFKLLTALIDNPRVPEWLGGLMSKRPDMPSERTVIRAELSGVDEQRIERILERARSFAGTSSAVHTVGVIDQ